ncbi:MAG: DUF2303 family protein [Sphingomonas oligoaromativorans]
MSEKSTTVAAEGVITEARSLIEAYAVPIVTSVTDPVTGTGAQALLLSGGGVRSLPVDVFDAYLTRPRFRHGSAAMLTLDSLIDHVNRFKDAESAVFADDSRERPSITAVLDYNPAGGALDGTAPRFGKHRSTFAFPLSDEWKAWTGYDGKEMAMGDFASFVENRLPDVLYIEDEDGLPEDTARLIQTLGGRDTIASPNKLLELSRGLQVHESSTVRNVVNLQSGESTIAFESQHTDGNGAPLKVPGIFMIGIPVFRSGQFYRVAARLRYRKKGGAIVFWYEMWRTDRTFDTAFAEAVERVKVETALPVYIGRPEA